MAWISSTITVRAVFSMLRPPSLVRSRYSDSGVVTRNVWRVAHHPGALARRRVAGAYHGADLGRRLAHLEQLALDPGERALEVAVDVVAQRLERRDVHDIGLVGERPIETLDDEVIDRGEKRGQRLARAGRRRDERVTSVTNRRPAADLRLGRGLERVAKPRGDGGVESIQDGVGIDRRTHRDTNFPSAAVETEDRQSSLSPPQLPGRCPQGPAPAFHLSLPTAAPGPLISQVQDWRRPGCLAMSAQAPVSVHNVPGFGSGRATNQPIPSFSCSQIPSTNPRRTDPWPKSPCRATRSTRPATFPR